MNDRSLIIRIPYHNSGFDILMSFVFHNDASDSARSPMAAVALPFAMNRNQQPVDIQELLQIVRLRDWRRFQRASPRVLEAVWRTHLASVI
ncbi:hypothetical protein [Paraburkholderia sacchari]|uniref:hypothetical protein n=1 Tax=Paraburkholderia sacchari TaxID=159450 RepID=UPI001BCF5FBA|nr:hypothetical protein [Paraburkholderia sacchari]